MIHRTKLNMADTWSKQVETSWQTFPLLYDIADKHYLNHVLKERTFLEIPEVIKRRYLTGITASNHGSSDVLAICTKNVLSNITVRCYL